MTSNVKNFFRELDDLLKKYNITDVLPVYIGEKNEHYISFFSNDQTLTFEKYECGTFFTLRLRLGNVRLDCLRFDEDN